MKIEEMELIDFRKNQWEVDKDDLVNKIFIDTVGGILYGKGEDIYGNVVNIDPKHYIRHYLVRENVLDKYISGVVVPEATLNKLNEDFRISYTDDFEFMKVKMQDFPSHKINENVIIQIKEKKKEIEEYIVDEVLNRLEKSIKKYASN